MKSKCAIVILLLNALVVALVAARALQIGPVPVNRQPEGNGKSATQVLPPLQKGVTDLNFSEFFATPVGPRGLEITDKLRNLNGQRVRIAGYMVEQDEPVPGKLLLAAVPTKLHEEHYGLADDLPPGAIHVFTRESALAVPYARQPLLLTGTLQVGNREERNGRISLIRLMLETPLTRPKLYSSTPHKGAGQASTKAKAEMSQR